MFFNFAILFPLFSYVLTLAVLSYLISSSFTRFVFLFYEAVSCVIPSPFRFKTIAYGMFHAREGEGGGGGRERERGSRRVAVYDAPIIGYGYETASTRTCFIYFKLDGVVLHVVKVYYKRTLNCNEDFNDITIVHSINSSMTMSPSMLLLLISVLCT